MYMMKGMSFMSLFGGYNFKLTFGCNCFYLILLFSAFFLKPEQEFPRQGKCQMYACQKLVQLLKQTLPLVQGILLFMRRLEKTSLVSCDESQCQFV